MMCRPSNIFIKGLKLAGFFFYQPKTLRDTVPVRSSTKEPQWSVLKTRYYLVLGLGIFMVLDNRIPS